MIIHSWNVNGYRAAWKKTFPQWLEQASPDVALLQETKAEPSQLTDEQLSPPGYEGFWNWSKGRKGYSGTAGLTRRTPESVAYGLPDQAFQGEGRVVRLDFPDFHLFNVYFPNGQMNEDRLKYKLGFYDAFLEHILELERDRPVVVGGDFNTAHAEIDLAHPDRHRNHSGFLDVERAWLDRLVASGYRDAFRVFESGGGRYTWWDMRRKARERNSGWRIDYFFVSEKLAPRLVRAWHETNVMGSDHCPVGIEIQD